MKHFSLRHTPPKGITLIEVVVAIGIMGIIMGGLVVFQKNLFSTSKTLENNFISQQHLRKMFKSLTVELRSAVPSAAGAYTIEVAATSSIIFYSNVDGDADIERVRYFFAPSSGSSEYNVLKKGIIKPSGMVYNPASEYISTVAYNLKNSSSTPIFTYFDASYDGTASSTAPLVQPVPITAIRLVKVSIIVDPNAPRSSLYQTHETQIGIRNLKDNL